MGKRTWLAGGLGLGVVIAVVVACGDDDAAIPAPPKDAGTGSETSSTPDGGGTEAYTLDNVCDRTASLVCDARKPCCTTFDAAGCLAHQKAECAKDVAAARAGTEHFHPDLIDSCLPKIRELLATCTFTFELLQQKGPELGACQIFDGTLPTDATCERTAQCQPSTTPGSFTTCDDDTKKCKNLTFLGEGGACSLGDGITTVCGSGLYCDVDFATFKGVCKKSTSLGVACDEKKKPLQLECGLGNYCDLNTKKCTIGKAGAASCDNVDLECASIKCLHDAGIPDGGACAPLKPLAKPEECTGP